MAKLTLDQLKRKIETWGPRGILAIRRGMEDTAVSILAYAISKKLSGPTMPRGVSGGFDGSTLGFGREPGLRTRLSQKTTVRGTEVTVKVGTNLKSARGFPYPKRHEYGGGQIPERPWLRPSVKKKQPLLLRNIKKAFIEAYNRG